MDADQLKQSLTLEQIEHILYALGSEEVVTDTGTGTIMTNTICHNESGGKLKLWYNDAIKSFRCFTGCGGHNYTIYNLIIQVYATKGINIEFKEAINWLKEQLGIDDNYDEVKGFGYSVKGKTEDLPTKRDELRTFDLLDVARSKLQRESVKLDFYIGEHLEQFSHHGSHSSFTNDHITSAAMDSFDIKSDRIQNTMIIPHRYWIS